MYKIMCDDYILHDSSIDDLKVINAKCNLELNKTGSLTFEVHCTHPYYNNIHKHTSIITLYQGGKVLFCGRVLNDEIDFDNTKYVECEGELSYLIDSIQRYKEYHINGGNKNALEIYLNNVISKHNRQVDDKKKFSVGVVNVTDANNYFYKISNYENTLQVLTTDLLDTYGGFLQIRRQNGIKYIDYLTELTNQCNQVIEFGKNIVDMTKYIKGEDIFTVLIPLGAKLDTENDETDTEETPSTVVEQRLTIEDLPDTTDGTIKKIDDYIYDTEAVKKWGWIWKVEKYDDVHTSSNLLNHAKTTLKNAINEQLSLELTAIDLSLLNVNVDDIKVGDLVQCVSKPHNVNIRLIVKSMDIGIDDPANTKIQLVMPSVATKKSTSITTSNKKTEDEIKNIKQKIEDDYTNYDDLNKFNDTIINYCNDNYTPKNDYDTFKSDYTTFKSTVNLSEYAKIVDVNNAFNQLASALGEV